jgi:hypothetical protein
MKRFQDVLDVAFGRSVQSVPAAPGPSGAAQAPSAALLSQAGALTGTAQAIEAVRRKRVDARTAPAEALVFEIVRHRGHWRTLHARKHSTPFPDQAAAVMAAKKLARKKRALGHPVEVVLRRTDGLAVVQSIDDDACASRPAIDHEQPPSEAPAQAKQRGGS